MKTRLTVCNAGSTLVVTIAVVAMLLALLGVAVDYSSQISRNTQRNRKTALAMEIADGHLETLFTNWRNIYRTTWTTAYGTNTGGTDYSLVGTNYFYTDKFKPGVTPAGYTSSMPTPSPIASMSPSGTPPIIPLPASTNFPAEANYTVNQYRIQAVDPMITLDANDNALVEGTSSKGTGGYVPMSNASVPPVAFGPNKMAGSSLPGGFPYSLYYLAAVDITVPTLRGNVTAKVRRIFEKKFDLPWTYAMFFVDDLELQPSAAFTINGPIHTNGNLYIGTSNFTAGSRVEYGHDYVNGYSPYDPRYPGSGFTAPTFAKSDSTLALSDMPPCQVSPYLPFGWNLTLSTASSTANDDSYHEIIERPAASPSPDPLAKIRYYSQAGFRIVINTNESVTIQKVTSTGTVTDLSGSDYNKFCANNGQGNSTTVLGTGKALIDKREVGLTGATSGAVRVTDVDVAKIVSDASAISGWTGLLYLADAGATIYNPDGTVKTAGTATNVTIGPTGSQTTYSTTKRAFRLINGHTLPSGGLTIVSENPVYIQGNYNTGSGTIPSNASGAYSNPNATPLPRVSSYTVKPSAVVADAVTILSGNWLDSNSNSATGIAARVATSTTVNTAIVSGNVASTAGVGGAYSGGGENFVRLLEDWNKTGAASSFTYYGSMVQLYRSNQAVGKWNGDGTVYISPSPSKFFYDTLFASDAPPGDLQIAAYLQQQRWYQVY